MALATIATTSTYYEGRIKKTPTIIWGVFGNAAPLLCEIYTKINPDAILDNLRTLRSTDLFYESLK